MFSRKKIAAVSGILCGLAVACTGAAQAHAAAGPGTCTVNNQGDIVCIQRIVADMPGDGIDRQTTSCVPVEPLTLPVVGVLNSGTTKIGPEVTCAPDNPVFKKAPGSADRADNGLELPGLLGG
ncbi:hypothetical protein ACFY1L_23095 [Streptomyces sp. NPDC001663]|uniref:hypothetical protein n=1 Tax=Streptomyces sp. NPDC001663 TaxID=3364597 RepID=UPI0036C65A0C